MTDQESNSYPLLHPGRAIALLMLMTIAGILVWSFHNLTWFGLLPYVVVGIVSAGIVGGLVGVPLVPTWAMLCAMTGLLEGGVQGWLRYGWIGSVLGGIIGAVVGMIVTCLLSMIMSFVLVICGFDPFVNADAGSGIDS
jgi:hypothetical protein